MKITFVTQLTNKLLAVVLHYMLITRYKLREHNKFISFQNSNSYASFLAFVQVVNAFLVTCLVLRFNEE